MADPATTAHPVNVNALAEWGKYPAHNAEDLALRVQYVRDELARLEAQGVSPLYVAVTLPLVGQQSDAFQALAEDGRLFALRLAEGCVPPNCDAQGRALPDEEHGKVLMAKVGTRKFASSGARASTSNRGGEIFVYKKITSKPTMVTLEDAITIMRQWGYRVRPKRGARPNQPPRRDEWLVVHVNDDGTPIGPSESERAASSSASPAGPRQTRLGGR